MKSGGTASIWGHDIDADPMNARGAIGIVPQELNMDPFFSPAEALEIQAGYYGVPKAERKTEEILKAVGLWDKRDAYARTLSGGMKRRLLVAKAMVHAPPVLVLDEPTAGVDVELRRQLWDYVRALHATRRDNRADDALSRRSAGALRHDRDHQPRQRHRLRADAEADFAAGPEDAGGDAADRRSRSPFTGFEDVTFAMRPTGAFALTYRTSEHRSRKCWIACAPRASTIKDLSIEEPDLEDVFVELTA